MVASRRIGITLTSCIVALLFFGCLALYNPWNQDGLSPFLRRPASLWNTDPPTYSCEDSLESLRREIELPARIQYSKRLIKAKATKTFKAKGTTVHLDERLFDDAFVDLDLDNHSCTIPPSSKDPIVIQMPKKTVTTNDDQAMLLFGASTTLERLEASIPQMRRWLGGSPASLLVVIEDSNNEMDLKAAETRIAAEADMNIEIFPRLDDSDENHGQRHFRLVQAMQQHRQPHHRWFVSIDDDTFFPSLPNLLAALRPYDPSESWYIGALSEDFGNIKGFFGYMAYGGAGIIMSSPLLETLDANFDSCNSPFALGGDILYRDCVFLHTSPAVSLTLLPGLHQLDLHGDGSGWYEGGIRPLLSLHHFGGTKGKWHRYPVQYGHLVVDVAGDHGFLQRYVFADDVVLTNGFSVVNYPKGLSSIDLNLVEATFKPMGRGIFDYSLGTLRPALPAEEKESWRLEYALRQDDGRVRQFYVKRKGHGDYGQRLNSEVESVLELEWST